LIFNMLNYDFHTINIDNIPENHNISELITDY
jgi:hypothetical protein